MIWKRFGREPGRSEDELVSPQFRLVSIKWLYGKLNSESGFLPCMNALHLQTSVTVGTEAVLKAAQEITGKLSQQALTVLPMIQLGAQRTTIHFLQLLKEAGAWTAIAIKI